MLFRQTIRVANHKIDVAFSYAAPTLTELWISLFIGCGVSLLVQRFLPVFFPGFFQERAGLSIFPKEPCESDAVKKEQLQKHDVLRHVLSQGAAASITLIMRGMRRVFNRPAAQGACQNYSPANSPIFFSFAATSFLVRRTPNAARTTMMGTLNPMMSLGSMATPSRSRPLARYPITPTA